MSRALALLRAQVDAGKTMTQVSLEIGYSRTAVSLFLGGKYDRDSRRLEVAIVRMYDRRHCPHLGEQVAPDLCQRKASTPKPFGGTARLAFWMSCQACPHKPDGDAK
jgi:DNA transposition AAA+ family ATPase